ncbi:MAG: N-acetylmuramoyl-L-alanine amidase [Myxococcota bacterium]
MQRWWTLLMTMAFGCTAPSTLDLGDASSMQEAAEHAEQTMGVPADLLLAISYTETRWQIPVDEHGFGTERALHIHMPTSVGVGGIKPWQSGFMAEATHDLGWTEEEIAANPVAGLVATAYVLRELAIQRHGMPPREIEAWAEVVADYAGHDELGLRQTYIEEVYGWLRRGVAGDAADGEQLRLHARPVELPDAIGVARSYAGATYPGARWVPAHTSNQSSRQGNTIQYVIVHTTQGNYSGAINWFQNADANVSAHFVIRSSDGQVTQMLDETANGWHAGNSTYNRQSIGIEHEGFVADPGRWYTDEMYRSSAQLTRWICDKHGIPMTRERILGHVEVPRATHTDPGTGWDWDRYMALVTGGDAAVYDAEYVGQEAPEQMVSGERAVVWVEMRNTGTATWDLTTTQLGTTRPNDRESRFYDEENWTSLNRTTGPDNSSYSSGSVGRFSFMITAPEVTEPTLVTESFGLVQEGVTWFGPDDVELSIPIVPRDPGVPDRDGDGAAADRDCDDNDAARFPGAVEVCGDGIDQNCSGADLVCNGPTMPLTPTPMESTPRDTLGGCSAGTGPAGWPVGALFVVLIFALRARSRRGSARRSNDTVR